MLTRSLAALLTFASIATPGSALAADSVGHRIELRAVVPVICRLDFSASIETAGEGAYRLGQLQEFCNSGSGYRIFVQYDAGSMEGAVLRAGGREVRLSGDGRDVLVDAPTAGLQMNQLELVLPEGANVSGGGLQLSIQAKFI